MSYSIDKDRLQQFNSLEFLARQVVEGFITGLHKSPFHGFSVEFAEHRLYNPGESTRFVDWKLYGRTDKMFVKRYEEETNLRCRIILDRSSSMYFPVKEKPDISTFKRLRHDWLRKMGGHWDRIRCDPDRAVNELSVLETDTLKRARSEVARSRASFRDAPWTFDSVELDDIFVKDLGNFDGWDGDKIEYWRVASHHASFRACSLIYLSLRINGKL